MPNSVAAAECTLQTCTSCSRAESAFGGLPVIAMAIGMLEGVLTGSPACRVRAPTVLWITESLEYARWGARKLEVWLTMLI